MKNMFNALAALSLLISAFSLLVVAEVIDVRGWFQEPAVEQELPQPSVPADYEAPEPESQVVMAQEPVLPYTDEDFNWMRLNIYFEARNQNYRDKVAVALVVMNRVADPRYGNTVKEVLTKARTTSSGTPIRNKCHFSWYCDGLSDKPQLNNEFEQRAWEEAGWAAHQVLTGEIEDFTKGALYYHAPGVHPRWAKADYAKPTAKFGHVFYARLN